MLVELGREKDERTYGLIVCGKDHINSTGYYSRFMGVGA